jgi:excisionase family DNA binding protein
MTVTLENLAAKLDRIERVLAGKFSVRASYTPREFAELVGRSYRWTVDRCAARTIRTVKVGGAYLIPASEVERFRTGERTVLER